MALGDLTAITLFVEDLATAKAFYADVFALPLIYEDESSAAFKGDHAIVNLLQVEAAHDLIAPGAVGGPAAGARFQLTTDVDDVDAVCARLREQGVELLNGPFDRPWGLRTASFTDPAGHIWEIAQPLPQSEVG